MADPSGPKASLEAGAKAAPQVKGDDTPTRSWVVPIATALALASAFCLYYFVYVGARREYLVNRNFRSLAALGDQLQRILSTHGSILEFYSELADTKGRAKHDRVREELKKFLLVRPEDKDLKAPARDAESQRDYLHYLSPTLDLLEPVKVNSSPSQRRPRMEVQRRDGRWQLVLTALGRKGAEMDYLGSLEIADLLKLPAESLPFDDILLVAENGTVVYQHKKAGPQFTTLSSLLKARVGDTGSKPPPASESKERQGKGSPAAGGQSVDDAWRGGAIHLTDVLLAGTRYKLFLQPILIDVFSDDPTRTEPAHEWALCGLRSSSALEWEALSVSYTVIMGFTALFLAICMSGPVLKVIFINHRERFRLRELGFLSLFLVLLASVFTLTAIQFVDLRVNNDTEAQLRSLGETLSSNIHDDLQQMRQQLQEWCATEALRHDLKASEANEVIRNTRDSTTSRIVEPTPKAATYAFVNNAFWTDDDGHQIVKWSMSGYVTPMIDLSKQRAYTAPKRTYLDGMGPPFHFDSILPPNKLEYLAALTVDTQACDPLLKTGGIRGDVTGGVAIVTAQPSSLVDPILPFGYGFALVDETGLVLFHSDKTKNGRENFREESDWSKELYAGTFGHSTGHSLRINYLGKDYRALVVPVRGVTQAHWSLIVYADLTGERTLALQTMTMTSTLILLILAGPALVAWIWCIVHRPRFAPEWLWPDPHRTATYLYQIGLYLLLTLLLLILGFSGPIEQRVIACAAIPYSALLLTLWCFRRYPSATEAWHGRTSGDSAGAPLVLTVLSGAALLSILILHWPLMKALILLPLVVGNAIVPLLDGPRRYVALILRRRRRAEAAGYKSGTGSRAFLNYAHCYAASVLLLLLMLGVLTPMALFRGCLAVERRLAVKQAQLHLASALTDRRATIRDKCEKFEIGAAACDEFKKENSLAWRKIVLNPSISRNPQLEVVRHEEPYGQELYEDWFRSLVYLIHHDYNSAAAETLGVIPDRMPPKPGSSFPEWSWEGNGATVKLRWHGVHPPAQESAAKESDLLITSEVPQMMRSDTLSGFVIATGVMLVIGGVFWMLVRKMFLVHLAPLKMTGEREVAEAIRQGRNVLILVPPISDFQVESPATTFNLESLVAGRSWGETVDLETLPSGGVIEIRHFEYTSDTATAGQKGAILERLMRRENTQVAAIMRVPASTEDYRRMFPQLTVIDLREEPFLWLKQYEGPARDLIWTECRPISALWPLGAQLARDIRSETIHSDDTIASEILERADPYYRLVWRECSGEQKFVLSQLAEDGLLNPMNSRAIGQLMRRGFIVQDPQFRIMNESFRRFLRSAVTDEQKQRWFRESRRSGWGRVHGAFFATMIVLGAFLLTTQNALWQSSAAYVTTAFGALGTLAKLFNSYRGSTTGEKAN
jgi:hypothetical protein